MDTHVKYLGLDLQSPIVAGSSGKTANIDNLCKLEDAGAGAVVLKSIFEEQIINDIKRNTQMVAPEDNYGVSYEYIAAHVANDSMAQYFKLIREAKQRLGIPVIGSINCFSKDKWLSYASQFQESGCDALELNMAILPCDVALTAADVERTFQEIVQTICKSVTIPVSIKVGPYFTDLARFMQWLSWSEIKGITMFNKSIQYDIDVEKEQIVAADSLSNAEELYNTIRWTAILSKKLRCNLSATTGVQTGEDVVKLLMAGATTVQVASSLYRNGVEYMKTLNDGLRGWMERKGYERIDQFQGKLAMKANDNASLLLRTQFMRYFAEI